MSTTAERLVKGAHDWADCWTWCEMFASPVMQAGDGVVFEFGDGSRVFFVDDRHGVCRRRVER